jgi:hypothetical protein
VHVVGSGGGKREEKQEYVFGEPKVNAEPTNWKVAKLMGGELFR